MNSAPSDCRSEDIHIAAVIIAELEFRNIQWQILFADLVESAHDAALNERPEALDRLSMDRTNDVLTITVADGGVREFVAELAVRTVVVGAEQAESGLSLKVAGQSGA
jgi:hypothetical protein